MSRSQQQLPHRLLFSSLILASCLLSACASVKMATPEQDVLAKSYKQVAGKSTIYVYRNETFGAAIKMPVELDGKPVGETAAHTFLTLVVAPGKHQLISRAANESVLALNTDAGKNYFVWQEVKMGLFSANTKLQLVNTETGQGGVASSKLIAIDEATEKLLSANTQVEESVSIEKMPFVQGVSSVTVEKIAAKNGCIGIHGAGILTDKGPLEIYRINCEDGRTVLARCELRQCQIMRSNP